MASVLQWVGHPLLPHSQISLTLSILWPWLEGTEYMCEAGEPDLENEPPHQCPDLVTATKPVLVRGLSRSPSPALVGVGSIPSFSEFLPYGFIEGMGLSRPVLPPQKKDFYG